MSMMSETPQRPFEQNMDFLAAKQMTAQSLPTPNPPIEQIVAHFSSLCDRLDVVRGDLRGKLVPVLGNRDIAQAIQKPESPGVSDANSELYKLIYSHCTQMEHAIDNLQMLYYELEI